MISPVTTRIVGRERVRHDVGERPPGEHRRARHRQRAEAVDQPLVQVLVEPERGDEPAEGDVLDDDPRDQEVDVAEAGRLDRAAEHVAEQQHEHDRLDREREQQLGRARQPDQVALGDDQRVGRRGASRGRSSASSSSASSAAWPVSARNTSSSVGRRSARSSTPTPASLEPRAPPRRSRPARSRTLTVTKPSDCSRRLVGHRRQRRDRRLGVAPRRRA